MSQTATELAGDAVQKADYARWPLIGCFLLILDLKLLYLLVLPGIWFLPDETIYFAHARHIALAEPGGSPPAIGDYGGVQPGLPLILAPLVAVFGGHSRLCYYLGVLLSSLWGTLVFWPAYAIARRAMSGSRGAAILTAAAVTVLPGTVLYGWAVITEPPYTFVLFCCAASYLRALRTGHVRDFLLCAALAAGSFALRPFGLCTLAAVCVGICVWGISARRIREPAVVMGSLLLLGAAAMVFRWYTTGQWLITSYGTESAAQGLVVKMLCTQVGWGQIAAAVGSDLAYLFVATGGIGLAGCILAIRKQSSAAGWAILAGTITLVATTLFLSALMRGIDVPEVMYGRYVEPLVGLLLIGGMAALTSGRGRWALLGVTAAALASLLWWRDPGNAFTLTNNPAYWPWSQVRDALGLPAAVALIVSLILVARFWARRRWLAPAVVLVAAAASSVALAEHLHEYHRGRAEFRQTVRSLADVLRQPDMRGRQVWVDPWLGGESIDTANALQYMVWLLRFECPDSRITLMDDARPPQAGELLLTDFPPPAAKTLWQSDDMVLLVVQ